jgi:hypothetical protein
MVPTKGEAHVALACSHPSSGTTPETRPVCSSTSIGSPGEAHQRHAQCLVSARELGAPAGLLRIFSTLMCTAQAPRACALLWWSSSPTMTHALVAWYARGVDLKSCRTQVAGRRRSAETTADRKAGDLPDRATTGGQMLPMQDGCSQIGRPGCSKATARSGEPW